MPILGTNITQQLGYKKIEKDHIIFRQLTAFHLNYSVKLMLKDQIVTVVHNIIEKVLNSW